MSSAEKVEKLAAGLQKDCQVLCPPEQRNKFCEGCKAAQLIRLLWAEREVMHAPNAAWVVEIKKAQALQEALETFIHENL